MRYISTLKYLINLLFPWVNSTKANKQIAERISLIENEYVEKNLDYMREFKKLTLDEVKVFFEKTLDIKKSLEDKLKTSLISVTLGITVLTSAVSFLFNDHVSSLGVCFKAVIFFVGSTAIIYMILAGIFAIKTISGFISVYQLFASDMAEKTDDEKKESFAICAELNSLSNIIRQNLMNVSFHCIVNSLFVIVIFFFLVGGSSFVIKSDLNTSTKIDLVLHPNKDDIDLINLEIEHQNSYNKKCINLINKQIEEQRSYLLLIDNYIKEIKKDVNDNRLKIEEQNQL